jgi:Tfp pilus assembly protein PilF
MHIFKRRYAGLLLLGLFSLLTAGCSKSSRQYIASGQKYLAGGKCGEAIIEFRNAVKTDPNSPEAHYQLALGQIACGRSADAYQSLMKTIKLNPRSIGAHLNLANLFLREGKPDEAIQYARQALAIAPDCGEAHLIQGSANTLKGDARAGVSELELYVRKNSSDPVGQQRLGAAYLSLNDLSRAEFRFEAALKLDPGSVNALAGIANVYLQQKQPEKAIQRLNGQLLLVGGPSQAQIFKILAEIYISEENPAKAEEQYVKALQVDPQNTSLRLDMAAFYEWNGNPGKSTELLKSLAVEQPGNIPIRKQLATHDR